MIIDCGSGMLRLANEFLNGPCGKGQGEVHIFLTHFHWDHDKGYTFFTPIYIKNNIINLYAVQTDLEKIIKLIFTPPMFPVPFDFLADDSISYSGAPESLPVKRLIFPIPLGSPRYLLGI